MILRKFKIKIYLKNGEHLTTTGGDRKIIIQPSKTFIMRIQRSKIGVVDSLRRLNRRAQKSTASCLSYQGKKEESIQSYLKVRPFLKG